MAIKLGKLSKVFKQVMYKDRMDVYHYEIREVAGDSYDAEEEPVPAYLGIPCKISNNFKDLPEEDSFMLNPTNQHLSIFCEPHYDIRKGDKIIIHRLDDNGEEIEQIIEYAGKPNKEITHQEISLVDRRYA